MKNHYNPFARSGKPLRKILNGWTSKELTDTLADSAKREWMPISEVKEINGRFEVLVELQNDFYREYHGGAEG